MPPKRPAYQFFKKDYYQEQAGYRFLHINGYNYVDGPDESNQQQGRYWQVRMSIKPTSENLAKAYDAVKEVYDGYSNANMPTIKLINIVKDDLSGWDPSLNKAEEVAERDQRGKELCLYLPYDNPRERYAHDAATIKIILLKLWAAMEKQGVEISYITQASDEKPLPVANASITTPFVYSAFKPFDKENPAVFLSQKDYNPQRYSDPLQDLQISKRDLAEYNIKNYQTSVIARSRLSYMLEHFKSFQNSPRKDLPLNKLHLAKEKESIEATFAMITPSSYSRLWQKGQKSDMQDTRNMQSIRTVLRDYSENTFLRLHWARHHKKQVREIVQQMDTGKLANADAVLQSLEEISLQNQVGSLARRTAFIKRQLKK